jgi:uncharacterized membrane protein YphA (DoxX/SURF4 family)
MTTETPQVTAPGAIRTDQLTHGALELPWTRWLFRSRQAGILWLIVRLWLGWQWFSAGWGKLTAAGYGNWFSHPTGLRGFIAGANSSYDHRAQAHGHAQVSYGWYLHILNGIDAHAQLFSRVVTLSELAVGIGLLVGCLTGIAAAGGVALNIMYITGGSAGPNASPLPDRLRVSRVTAGTLVVARGADSVAARDRAPFASWMSLSEIEHAARRVAGAQARGILTAE